MPNTATLSILGLFYADNSIFDDLYVPASVDSGLLIANILDQCSELECIYPDAEYMKFSISVWSAAEGPTWDRLAELDGLTYNPLENYDRWESETTGRDRSRDIKRTTSDAETTSGISHSEQDSTNSRSESTDNAENNVSNTVHNVTGYNTNTPVTDNADNATNSTNKTGTVSGSGSDNTKNNSVSSSESQRDGTDNTTEGEQENLVKNSHIHGNIGVKSAQQMIKESIDLAPQLNLVNYITESFKLRFCIMVY